MTARAIFAACVLLAAIFGAAVARAQPPSLPAAGAPAGTGASPYLSGQQSSHGWLVREAPRYRDAERPRWQIYHIPPRRATFKSDGLAHGSRDGSLRPSRSLAQRPQAIAAWERKAWFIFEAAPADPKKPERDISREVLSLSANARGSDLWTDSPTDRFSYETGLPGRGRLAGFVGSPVGPVALLDHSLEGASEPWQLRVLAGDHWIELPLPKDLASERHLSLVADGDGVSIVASGRALIEWWRGRWKAGGPEAGPSIDWSTSTRPLSMDLTGDEAALAQYTVIDRALYAVTPGRSSRDWTQARVVECDVSGARLVANAAGPGGKLGVVPIEGQGRLFLVWDNSADRERVNEPLTVAELSVWTGRTLFAGSAQMTKPLAKPDLLMLAFALFLVVASVVLFVFRPDSGSEVSIPEGLTLADPFRRFIASAFDVFIALIIASRLVDLPIASATSVDAVVSGQTLWLLAATLVTGFCMSTAGEVLFSRSIGKALVGCFVIQLPEKPVAGAAFGGATSVGVLAAVIRNGIKWGMPPVVILTFLEPSGRHRAESLTRTAVVVPDLPEDSEGDDASGGDEGPDNRPGPGR